MKSPRSEPCATLNGAGAAGRPSAKCEFMSAVNDASHCAVACPSSSRPGRRSRQLVSRRRFVRRGSRQTLCRSLPTGDAGHRERAVVDRGARRLVVLVDADQFQLAGVHGTLTAPGLKPRFAASLKK